MRKITLALLCLLAIAQPLNAAIPDIRARAGEYFSAYSERRDFDRFMSFYADNATLEDMVYGSELAGKAAIRDFFNWPEGSFRLTRGDRVLVVQKQVVEGNTVVTEGYFNAFEYQGQPLGPWRFVIWLEFDKQGKISRQVDWINYTPKEQFTGGADLNRKLAPSS